jgi:hypothetical protein
MGNGLGLDTGYGRVISSCKSNICIINFLKICVICPPGIRHTVWRMADPKGGNKWRSH